MLYEVITRSLIMFEDLKLLVDLQIIDNEIYQLTSEERNTENHISRMKHEIEESAIKRVKLIRKQRELQEDKEVYEADILDHKRILDQKHRITSYNVCYTKLLRSGKTG